MLGTQGHGHEPPRSPSFIAFWRCPRLLSSIAPRLLSSIAPRLLSHGFPLIEGNNDCVRMFGPLMSGSVASAENL